MIKETMTSRQRVYRAMRHLPTDRVPIDLGSHFSTGINGFAYHRLREYLGLPTERLPAQRLPTQRLPAQRGEGVEIATLRWFLARVDEDVLRRFHCDCMLLAPSWEPMKTWAYDERTRFRIPAALDTYQNETGNWCLAENGEGRLVIDRDTREIYPEGKGSRYFNAMTDLAVMATHAEQIFKETEYAAFAQGPGAIYHNNPDWLCRLVLEPDEMRAVIDAQMKGILEHVGEMIRRMGEYVQGYVIGSDLGTQRGPYINPALYEALIAPAIRELCSFIHRNSDMKVVMHSCGAIRPFIPIFIDCGIDVLNPVQISAVDMEPEALKRDFGSDIVFWGGGCDTQHVLGTGTPADVADNVRHLMSVFKPGGGYVFNQVQDIVANVPSENIVTMLDTAYAESFY